MGVLRQPMRRSVRGWCDKDIREGYRNNNPEQISLTFQFPNTEDVGLPTIEK